MRDGIQVQIKGLEHFKRGLQSLPIKMARQIQNKAISEAAKFMRQKIVEKTPIDHGWLISSIKVKGKKLDDWSVEYRAGSYYQPGDPHPVWYAHIVERGGMWAIGKKAGAAIRAMKKGIQLAGHKLGHRPARPFVRPAWDANIEKAQSIIAEIIGKGVQRAYKKIGPR
jgi:HK97 gp10 family phage protein